jgi:hypothetical protein
MSPSASCRWVARARGRAELAMFAAPAATIEPLDMCVHVLPLDTEVPVLIDVTDPRRMGRGAARHAAAEAAAERPRRRGLHDRAGELTGDGSGACCATRSRATANGSSSTASSRRCAADHPTTRSSSRCGPTSRAANGFTIPRLLGFRPELGLALLEEVPGEGGGRLRVCARAAVRPSAPWRAATGADAREPVLAWRAALHGSGLRLGAPRTLEDDLQLSRATPRSRARSRPRSPSARADGCSSSRRTRAVPSRCRRACATATSKHAQLFFDGPRTGMVDFDTICRAEPALDLGHFLAYLYTQIEKTQRRGKVGAAPRDLGERFLREYLAATEVDERQLRCRIAIYEAASLMRMALHSRQKFQDVRLDGTLALLEERMSLLS